MNKHLQDAAYHWILKALAVNWQGTPADIPAETRPDAFWDAVKSIALQHRVAGPLYDRTLSHPALFPEELARWLRLLHSGEVLRYERQRQDVGRLLKALAAAEVRVLVIKGWALAAILYAGDMGRRRACDLDIVVAPDDLARARKVLAGLGYAEKDAVPELWPGFNQRYYSPVYYAPSGHPRMVVDLHVRPLKCCVDPALVRELTARAQPVPIGEAEALAPATEDHLFCLCGHLALHHSREESLFRYHDMAELIHSKAGAFNWDALFQRATKWGLAFEVQAALNAVATRWPEMVPATVLQQAAGLRRTFGERLIHKLARTGFITSFVVSF